ncbi:MAG: hypothetical protein LBQ22_08030 [Bacteroidales bacterium]|jgi:hypothetical protein|nr:hypothetical protein [Bacteroidales bacterium]
MMNVKNGTPTTQQTLRTYFDNNLTVIKDATMFKLLFKLRSIDQLEYNKAKKDGNPTNNIKFQISINELIYDTQIGKKSLLLRLAQLEKIGLISKKRTKEENNANGKNEYQFNMLQLEKIVSKLNDMKRRERIDYINQIFPIPTKNRNEQVDPDNEKQEEVPTALTPAEIERQNNIKANEALDKLQREESIKLMAEFQQREVEKLKSKMNQNKAIGATLTQEPITITKGELKMAPSENIATKEQCIPEILTNREFIKKVEDVISSHEIWTSERMEKMEKKYSNYIRNNEVIWKVMKLNMEKYKKEKMA